MFPISTGAGGLLSIAVVNPFGKPDSSIECLSFFAKMVSSGVISFLNLTSIGSPPPTKSKGAY